MFPVIEYIKTCLNGLRSRIEKIEKSISRALASVKAQLKENAEAIKSSTADWGQNDSNALDYVKNRTHYMLPATPIGSLDFTATSSNTIEYTMNEAEEEFAIFQYFQAFNNKGEVLKIIVDGKEGLLAVTFERGYFGFSGVFTGSVYWRAGNVLSLVAQNDFITFYQGYTYTVSFEDTTKPYYSKLDFNYIPDNVYHSENAPVKFGAGKNSTVQGDETTADGWNSHAEGNRSAATGPEAHAEGSYTKADGTGSHAEGITTEATGDYSHAEGSCTKADGDYSHAEGNSTEASGYASHAEGDYTVANRLGMHVEGKYNLYDSAKYADVVSSSLEYNWRNRYAASEYTFDADTGYYTLVNAEPKSEAVIGLYYAFSDQYKNGTISELEKPISLIDSNRYKTEKHQRKLASNFQGKYAHVVGNGVSSARSNAYTLDWDGNGWFAGDVFVGGTGQDEGVKLLKAGEAIPIPQTASVGQVLAVKAVDETGKPTEWEAADMGSSGGGAGGTNDHSKLINRDAADQHPMKAITGLEAALDGKQPAGSYLTEESDPTVPAWAKEAQKPSYTAQEVGADPSGTAAGLVSAHNTAEAAHNDIRLLISGLTQRLNALADSDDTTLDQLSEVVAYIKANRELIASITTDKVSVTDIVNDLVTNVTNKPLSAAQGVALKALIDAITIPTALPNPNALTFTGAVTGSYDGSAPLSVEIPSGGVDTVQKINATFSGSEGYVIPSNTSKTVYKCGRIVFINLTLKITAADEKAWHVIVADIPSQIDTNEHIMSFISRDGRGPCRVKVDGNNLVVAGGENSGATASTWYDIQYIYISAD